MSALLDNTNSTTRYAISDSADLYQRRPLSDPYRGWTDCPRREAICVFERLAGFEYRALKVLPMVGSLLASSVVVVPKPNVAFRDEIDANIVRWADRFMKREYDRDESHGYFFAKAIANAIGISKNDAKIRLEGLVSDGHLRIIDFANGNAWRSINLLPHEAR